MRLVVLIVLLQEQETLTFAKSICYAIDMPYAVVPGISEGSFSERLRITGVLCFSRVPDVPNQSSSRLYSAMMTV